MFITTKNQNQSMAELTQEELSKMSPEEIKEMQKKQCIFCKIISKEIPGKIIYEDKVCMALLDINPANPGHIILVPKEHYSILPLMPHNEVSHLFNIAKRISENQIGTLKCDGTNIFVANGSIAGQRSPHVMIHIIPRKENDGITVFNIPKNDLKLEDSIKLKELLQAKLADMPN